MGVDFDDVRGVSRAVVLGEAGDHALLQLLDPLDFPLEAVANIDGEAWVLGVENVPLGAVLEGIGVGFDEVLESVDPGIEFLYLGCMVVLSLFDCLK